MKKQLIIALMLLAVFTACNKDEEDAQPPQPTINADITEQNNGITTGEYAPYTTGSTFDYKYIDALGEETLVTWTVFEEKLIGDKFYIGIGGFLDAADKGYFNCEDGDYSIYIPANEFLPAISMIYMKEGVPEGTEWEELTTMTMNGLTFSNKHVFSFVETHDSRTVEGVTYNNIIHIHLDTYMVLMGVESLESFDDYYWAKGVGLIEKNGYSGDIRLLSYDIQ